MVELLQRYANDQTVAKRLRSAEKLQVKGRPRGDKPATPYRYKLAQRLGPGILDQIVADYRDGIQTPELAERYALSKSSIKKLLHVRGISLHYRVLDSEHAARACELYAEGLSLEKVGTKLGCSRKAVTTALENAGIQRRDVHGRPRT
jgi:hypothetical protein